MEVWMWNIYFISFSLSYELRVYKRHIAHTPRRLYTQADATHPWLTEHVAELLARLADGRRVHNRHQVGDVVDEDVVEELLVALL